MAAGRGAASYADLGHAAYGAAGRWVVRAVSFGYLFGTCASMQLTAAIALVELVRDVAGHRLCLVTAGIFLPLFTIGFPVYMLIRLASFSTSWGQARLKRQQGDQYDATVGTYRRQFNFFVSKCMPHASSQGTSRDQPVHAPHGPLTCRR